ncbi:MAG: hypothetical protein ACJAUH_002303, partial [Saprospiraceae bacterium]
EDYEKYETIFNEKLGTIIEKDQEVARNYLLGIYANPVINAQTATHF